MEFVKMEGCGNDYVYVNGFNTKIDNPNELCGLLNIRLGLISSTR